MSAEDEEVERVGLPETSNLVAVSAEAWNMKHIFSSIG